MDIETKDKSINDLSFKLEDMDLDNSDNEEELSKQMDEKIKTRIAKIEDEEMKQKELFKAKESKKKKEEEIKLEKMKKLSKQRIQKKKDEKKRGRKTSKCSTAPIKSKIPNIRPVPQNCIHLVNKGDLVYGVPGDGSCGPNSASAFLFKDEVFGRKLRRRMNMFMAKHWKRRYQYLTQCSKDDPFVRRLGEGEKKYTDPLELVKYLETSEEAASLWTDAEDLAVISDMYQVKIKVITTKGEADMNPTVNWILPDATMSEFADLKDVEINDMVLLHQNDSHFDLVVSKDSELAKLGSLSYQTNIGPMRDSKEDVEVNSINEKEFDATHSDEETDDIAETSNDAKDNEIKELRKELKKVNETKKVLESDFTKCELELRNKTEEVEILRIEIRDLKKIVELEEQISSNIDINEEGLKEDRYSSTVKSTGRQKPTGRQKNNRYEPEFNCAECYFQGTTKDELTKHIRIKHKVKVSTQVGALKCRNCGEAFSFKTDLMDHRKSEHLSTVAVCRNYSNGNCPYSSSMCWWLHADQQEIELNSGDSVKCYICCETFETKGTMMIHRKKEHKTVVRVCNLFLDGKCRFKETSCWFNHEEMNEYKSENEDINNKTEESVFQEVQENLKPPIQHQQSKSKSQEEHFQGKK